MAKVTFGIFFFLLTIQTGAQNEPAYENFTVTAFQGKVYLSWILPAGSTCFGIQVYRSEDGEIFEEIGWFYGICGSNSESVPYSFVDEEPMLNQTNYYRIELGKGFFSDIISVQVIDLSGKNSQVRPNPVVDVSAVYFTNGSGKNHTLSVYDLNGKLINAQSTHLDFFEVNASSIPFGLYIYAIISDDGSFYSNGKLIIGR
ncbi:MAG: T9SS type A sorting domain-containing protein [Bacteroidales bacterium]